MERAQERGGYVDYIVDENMINSLYAQGVRIFASSGNYDMNVAFYPASYTNVYSVGGIYDDADGFYNEIEIYTREPMPSSYTGSRISMSSKHFFTYPYNRLWGSNWRSVSEEDVSFMGPGFDVEVFIEGKGYVTTEGTSFSCPFIAAIALLVYHVCEDAEILDKILAHASEGLTDGKCVQPAEGENYRFAKSKVMGYGYGAIDAYDAIWLAVNKLLSWFHLYCPSEVSGMQVISIYDDIYGFIIPLGQIQKVEFYIDNDKIHTDTSYGKYEYSWHTYGYSGQVVVKAIIYDHYGNTIIRTVNVYVNPGGGGGGGGGGGSFW